MRKIAVVTGTRAEYGLLYWIIKGIADDPDLNLQLIATGMHLLPEFGNTVDLIEKDGFVIAEKVAMLLPSDTETAIATSMGMGLMGFAKAYERLSPDLIVVLGDRFEILSAVAAAMPFRIPVAHIHGGEATEGLIDELIRHAVTKMSHIHFVSAELYRRRVIQMGENPEHVFCFGAPGLDNVRLLDLFSREKLCAELKIPFDKKFGIVTFHPVTLERNTSADALTQILKALAEHEGIFWVFTMPNADTGGRKIGALINAYVTEHPADGKAFTSLGQVKYLSLMKHAEIMVGNSSSGLIEAPSFSLPVVNIGDRQRGRVRAENVIDVSRADWQAVSDAIRKALSRKFRETLAGMQNPYGTGHVSERIVATLKDLQLNGELIKKRFFDIAGNL
jgi:UDP-hydrolysing UDP-N-acetyl-D-glucosamine 2-epimerase